MLKFDDLELHQLFSVPVGVVRMPKLDDKIRKSLIESKVASAKDRAVVAVNHAKWAAAMAYCKAQGFTFRVITEDDLFRNGSRK